MDINKEELQHHGILGQKWGKKNGPPYPISSSNHSASEKKAGWKKSLDDSKKTEDKKSFFKKKDKKTEEKNKISKNNSKNEQKKSIKDMDDEELKKRYNRLKQENLYREELKKANTKEGKSKIDKILKTGETIARAMGTAITIYNNYNKIMEILGIKTKEPGVKFKTKTKKSTQAQNMVNDFVKKSKVKVPKTNMGKSSVSLLPKHTSKSDVIDITDFEVI